jgi:hypothetical protein
MFIEHVNNCSLIHLTKSILGAPLMFISPYNTIFHLMEPPSQCHTCFSKENQVQTYMHARIKFHAYSDI